MKSYDNSSNFRSPLHMSIFIFLFSLCIVACKKGEGAEPTPDGTQTGKYPFPIVLDAACLLTKTESGNGILSTMEYNTNKKLTTYHTHIPANEFLKELNSTYTMTRDKDGNVNKIQAVGDNGITTETIITYNNFGNWIKTQITDKSSSAYVTIFPEYNEQGLIIKITRKNVNVNNPYTSVIDYTYEKGNISTITNYTTNNPVISKLEYDLTREAKWSEFDLIKVYLGSSKPLHKNVLKKIITPTLNAGSFSENNMTYQFNDKGYPTQVSSVSVVNGVTSKPIINSNIYKCE